MNSFFDLNRRDVASTVMISDPGPLTNLLMTNDALPFALTLITPTRARTARQSCDITNRRCHRRATTEPLDVSWPAGVISLSHVALPFPPDDPCTAKAAQRRWDRSSLGQIAVKGERGLLLFPSDWLLRLRHNPFYELLERRTLEWIGTKRGSSEPATADTAHPRRAVRCNPCTPT